MNNLIRLKGPLNEKKNLSTPGQASFSTNRGTSTEKLISLKKDLEGLYNRWSNDQIIDGALVSVFYDRIVPKSKRIKTLLSKGSELSNESIKGAKFSEDGEKHIITHFVSLSTIKKNIEKLNSEIEKIANEKEETQEKEKPSILFIVITVVLAIALICSIILIKNYIVSGILGVALIANIVFYVINKNKQKVNKAKLREKINQEKQYKREKLENQKQQIIANVNTTEKELEKQEEEEKQVKKRVRLKHFLLAAYLQK